MVNLKTNGKEWHCYQFWDRMRYQLAFLIKTYQQEIYFLL